MSDCRLQKKEWKTISWWNFISFSLSFLLNEPTFIGHLFFILILFSIFILIKINYKRNKWKLWKNSKNSAFVSLKLNFNNENGIFLEKMKKKENESELATNRLSLKWFALSFFIHFPKKMEREACWWPI